MTGRHKGVWRVAMVAMAGLLVWVVVSARIFNQTTDSSAASGVDFSDVHDGAFTVRSFVETVHSPPLIFRDSLAPPPEPVAVLPVPVWSTALYGQGIYGSPPVAVSVPYATPPASSTANPGATRAAALILLMDDDGPSIISISPLVGTAGSTIVTITGSDFSFVASENQIAFTGIPAVPAATVTQLANGNMQLTVIVPGNAPAGSGPITLSVLGDSAVSNDNFAIYLPQTITFNPPAAQVYAPSTTFSLSASASSGLPVTFSVSPAQTCVLTGPSTVLIVGAGTCTVSADQAGSSVYAKAATVTGAVVINRAAQTITFSQPTSQIYGPGKIFNVSASASSGLPVSFSAGPSSICTMSGASTVAVQGAGSCSVSADQAGSNNYNPAPTVTRMVAIAPPVVSLSMPPSATPINDAVTHDATVGTMAGQASTDGGAAQYHIPIVVPPGRAGMQPELALVYNSRGGNGVMGIGWTISGLSSIHRCPQTPEQDGMTVGVAYAATDRLCLDGQRLVRVAGSNYGLNGAEYRTEVDSYTRITQVGGDIGNWDAACFRVEQKDGRILHYGGVTSGSSCSISTAASRVKPSGAPAALSWLVEKIEDRVGNNQFYTYVDKGNGEVLLSKAEYTGYGTNKGNRSVNFAYQPRTSAASGVNDISSSYLSSGLTMQTQALQSITVMIDATSVRTYTPTYTVSSYSQRLMLMSLKECAVDANGTVCHPETQFGSTERDAGNVKPDFHLTSLVGLNIPTTPIAQALVAPDAMKALVAKGMAKAAQTAADPNAGDMDYRIQSAGDMDGDGSSEVALHVGNDSSSKDYLIQLTPDRQVRSAVDVTGLLCFNQDGQDCYGDFGGDGRSEAILFPLTSSDPPNIRLAMWSLGRGVIATAGSQPLQTLVTNIPAGVPVPGKPGGVNGAVHAVDINGDGKLDIIVEQPGSVEPNNCGNDAAGMPTKAVFVYLNKTQVNPQTGRMDAAHPPTFSAGIQLTCLRRVTTAQSYWMLEERIDHIADFDGDGIPDIFIGNTYPAGDGNGSAAFSRLLLIQSINNGTVSIKSSKSCTDIGLVSIADNDSGSRDECARSTGYAVHWMDVNGDGLEDFVISRPNRRVWEVRLNQGGTAGLGPVITTTGLGSGAGQDIYNNPTDPTNRYRYYFKYLNRLPLADIDADGKPEILVVSAQQGFALKMCVFYALPLTSDGECRTTNTTTGPPPDPTSPICPAYACPQEPGTGTYLMPGADPNGGFSKWGRNVIFPMYGSDTDHPDVGFADTSAYHLAAVKFVQTDATHIRADLSETPIVSTLSKPSSPPSNLDVFGDGLQDVVTRLGCQYGPFVLELANHSISWDDCLVVDVAGYGPSTLSTYASPTDTNPTVISAASLKSDYPIFINQNVGTGLSSTVSPLSSVASVTTGLPSLLSQATSGLGDSAQWSYLPLGQPIVQDGIPLYTIKNPLTNGDGGYADDRHYYFASSMPVVSAMTQSNGLGGVAGARSAVYGYSEAMYNHLGRGFQGFRTISVENAASDASQRLVTTTTFKQKFPLVGKIEQVTTRTVPANGSRTIHAESSAYLCIQSSGGLASCPQSDSSTSPLTIPTAVTVQRPVATSQTSKDYDLATGAQSGHSTTSNSQWDIYGNLLAQTVTRGDDAAGGQFMASHTVSTTNTYTPNAANWTIDLPDETRVQTSISYARSVPIGVAAPPTQTLDTKYAWNPDRSPQSKTIQPQSVIGDANQESMTGYSYPSPNYGLPSQVQVTGPSIAPSRTMNYGYSADGYFVATTTNGLGQTVTTVVQARDGRVTKATDANYVSTGTTYDAFGRAVQVTHRTSTGSDIEPPINIAYTNCVGGCGGQGSDSNDAYSIYRTLTAQQGYPTKVAWYDLLGRTVKQAQAGFSGTSGSTLQYAFSATRTWFDENGRTWRQSTPYYVGMDSPSYTEFGYDALSRVTAKSAPAACGGGTMDTTSSYVGRQTNIAASGVCSGGASNTTIKMSRSSNVLGQLMQTIDANGNTTFSNGKITSYWTDALGHAAAIQDVEGNVTQATYNALGHRLQSADPDQGTWNFSYNALGELTSQTDARGVVTTVTGRDALGRMTQRQQVSPTTVNGLAAENLFDAWSYDPLNGVGQLGGVTRRRGSGTPGSNPVTWSESYAYDPAVRPIAIATTINESGSTLNLSSSTSYDNVGRVDTQTYPALPTGGNTLAVKRSYTAYGQLDALSNAGTSYVYWTMQSQNAWGHVTSEQYPGVITGSHSDYTATGQTQTLSWSGSVNDQVVYTYDSFGNLNTQQRNAGGSTNTENYTYDSLQRLKIATRAVGAPVNYAYSPNGNITSKNDNGTGGYSYPPVNGRSNGCGPHAAISANGQSYICDANGNVIGGAISATYDADNHPRSINRGGGTMSWTYSTTGAMTSEVSSRGLRYFGPNGYEQIGTGSGATQVYELGPVIVTRTGGVDNVSVVLRDRLGSTISVIDANAPTTRWYDAFGKVRNGDMSDRFLGGLSLDKTIHGFTKHDHADDVQLIHMGGRVYDYSLGRFLNVDPIIANPQNSQSLNPYSYVGNNPLSGVDPTGYTTRSDTRSLCFQSLMACGMVSGKESVSALSAARQQSKSGKDSMTSLGATSTPNSGKVSDTGSLSKSVAGKQLAQGAEPARTEETVRPEERDATGRVKSIPEIGSENVAARDVARHTEEVQRDNPKYRPPETTSGRGVNNPNDQMEIIQQEQQQKTDELLAPMRNQTDQIVRGGTNNTEAPSSTYDTSITSAGSRYLNVRTNVTASQFQSNLTSNGYSVTGQGTNANGTYTILGNGTSTYTIYMRSSTGEAGAQYFGPNGASAKFSLGGQ